MGHFIILFDPGIILGSDEACNIYQRTMVQIMSEILVLSTADSIGLAQKIASALVEAREAACVNIVPGMQSVYHWQGKLCNEAEILLIIKSTAELIDAINATIHRLHSYQVPEVIAVPIANGDPAYLKWIRDSTSET
jgi:periplasmic divalent cation tolerance protein